MIMDESALCFKCRGEGVVKKKKKSLQREKVSPPTNCSEACSTAALHPAKPSKLSTGIELHSCRPCQGAGVIYANKKRMNQDTAVVTKPKRPSDWLAPGPKPRPINEVELLPGEALCYLTGDWRIIQPIGGHRYSTDDLVTAYVAHQAAKQIGADEPLDILDLGSGLGSVALMITWLLPNAVCVGVEAQANSVARAQRSAFANNCDDRCTFYHHDIREIDKFLPKGGSYDLVTGTPPYFPISNTDPPLLSKTSENGEKSFVEKDQNSESYWPSLNNNSCPALAAARDQRPCNWEFRGGIEAYCEAAYHCCRPGGVFVVCEAAGPNYIERVENAAKFQRKGGCSSAQEVEQGLFNIENRLDVIPREGKPPLFSVYTMRKCATGDIDRHGDCAVDTLTVRDATGHRTSQYLAVLDALGMPP